MKVALYTALYGRYDWVKPVPKNLGVPAYFYTDNLDLAAEASECGWEPKFVPHSIATLKGEPGITGPMLNHKYWKTHPEVGCPGVDVSLWVDASMEIVVDDYVDRCLASLGDDDWSNIVHPARDCIYPEAKYSASLIWRYDGPSILAQMANYQNFHPPKWGLFASGANVRRHTPGVLELCEQWWYENLVWSHQDQISLPVLMKIFSDQGKVKFNTNLPWHETWVLHIHQSHRDQ